MNNIELANKVRESLKGSVAKAKKFEDTVAVSFSLLSEENEDIYVTVREGQLMVEPYHYDDNNCEVEASADVIAKMFTGEIAFDKALSDGMVQIKSGDQAKLKALECLVPSKKAAAKKPETKPTKSESKPEAKSTTKPETKSAAAKTETKPAAKTETKPAATGAKNGKKK